MATGTTRRTRRRPGVTSNTDYAPGPVIAAAKKSASKRVAKTPERRERTPQERFTDRATVGAPAAVKSAAMEVATDESMNDALTAVMERNGDGFQSYQTGLFAAIGMNAAAREHLDKVFDREWQRNTENGLGLGTNSRVATDVVVGAGLHAAVYCAVRVATGGKPPLVLESSERAGGVFAVSRGPSFYLNSRNRPGGLSLPGIRGGALNVLPGAVVQPSDLSGDEYQVNSDVAWSIRATLAMNARVLTGVEVSALQRSYSTRRVPRNPVIAQLRGRQPANAERIVVSTGLGSPRRIGGTPIESERILTFAQLMARMDDPFPLRGMDRVAVIGAGDSGRTAIEALCGQGPRRGWSVAALDWPSRIDWYGVLGDAVTRTNWEACNRSRYKGIGRLLPRATNDEMARVKPLTERAATVSLGFDTVYVNDRPYDHVIYCLGYNGEGWNDAFDFVPESVDGRIVGKQGQQGSRYPLWLVGPGARLDVTTGEQAATPALGQVRENATAIFRYAKETAALAAAVSRRAKTANGYEL